MLIFAAVQSLLLAALAGLSYYVFWDTVTATLAAETVWDRFLPQRELDPLEGYQVGLAIAGFVVLHQALDLWGRRGPAFWLAVGAGLLPQMPAVLSHSLLTWTFFWEASLAATELSQATVALTFVAALVLLVALNRLAELRRLNGVLTRQRGEAAERQRVMTAEVLALAGLIGLSLAITAVLMAVGSVLGGLESVFIRSPWTVFSVGVAAIFLVACFAVLWGQTRQRG